MKKVFKAEFGLVHSDLDNYQNGCTGKGSSRFIEPIVLKAETLSRLIEIVCKHFNVEKDALLLNSCEELGRVDVQTYTKTLNSLRCQYYSNKIKYMEGIIPLYLNNISGYITVQAEGFDLESILNNENTKGLENNAIIF